MLRKAFMAICLLVCVWPTQVQAWDNLPPELSEALEYEGPDYVVQPGDTLFSIAAQHGATVEALARINALADPRHIYVGQQLRLTPHLAAVDTSSWAAYRVALGEDLALLAQRSGVETHALAEVNGLLNPAQLRPGQTVLLPPRADIVPAVMPAGESLLTLALRQGVSYWSLAILNPRPVYTHGPLLLPSAGNADVLPRPVAHLRLSASSADRGQTLVLELETLAPAVCEVSYLGKTTPCYNQDDTHLFALLGIDPMLDPGTYDAVVRVQTSDSTLALQFPLTVTAGRFGYERIDLPPDRQNLLDQALVQAELNTLARLRGVRTETRRWEFPFQYPLQAAVSSYFGSRRSYGGAFNSYHAGVDFRAGTGMPVRAPAAGTVILSEPLLVRGNAVMVDHGWGLITGYWHLSRNDVTVGQRVAQGDILGRVGNTGLSTGAHLHWEVWVDGQAVDPLQWVAAFYDIPAPILPVVAGAQ